MGDTKFCLTGVTARNLYRDQYLFSQLSLIPNIKLRPLLYISEFQSEITSNESRIGSVLYSEVNYYIYSTEEAIETYLLQSQYDDQPSPNPETVELTTIVNCLI
jgi:hypothetical protein